MVLLMVQKSCTNEVGSLSHYLQGFIHPNGGWPWVLWTIKPVSRPTPGHLISGSPQPSHRSSTARRNAPVLFLCQAHTIHGTGILYLHECLIFMVNVDKYTSPMDAMGTGNVSFFSEGILVGKLWLDDFNGRCFVEYNDQIVLVWDIW